MFAPWTDLVPKFKYSPSAPYFSILVPTSDTVRYASLLRACIEVRGLLCIVVLAPACIAAPRPQSSL
jgi:hypothetical protein